MPKRKRSQITSEDSKDSTDSVKRRKTYMDVGALCQELYDTIRNHKTEDGRVVCETFLRAPNRRSLPDYYDIVTMPIDLMKIQQKIKTDDYADLDQFSSDVELLVNNAKTYYKRHMPEFKDASEIWDVFVDAKSELFNVEPKKDYSDIEEITLEGSTSDRSMSECGDDESPFEELFTAIMTAADMDGRSLSTMFQLLPSKTLYPEYYKVIQDPIDLKTIAQKIQGGDYNMMIEMEKELFLMIKNAKIFNEPGSQIYKDAATLKRIINIKKSEIDQRKSFPSKSSERIRSKRSAPCQKWSSLVANLKYNADGAIPVIQIPNIRAPSPPDTVGDDAADVDDGNESDPEDAENNPLWQLYETVKNYVNPQGYVLSEPFWRLPCRRSYPDYYKEIKQPMSLFKIRVKIKSRQYSGVVDVVDDLNLMFENAKKYNRQDSKLFKDAVKLQKIMQAKARELINLHIKDSESDVDEDDERSSSSTSTTTTKRKYVKKILQNTPGSETKKPKKSMDGEISLKKKFKALYKSVHGFNDDDGRPLIAMFMDKPSKKDYPDYYEIIANPMDMKTIEGNIKSEKYASEDHLIADFRLMFANCRHYNEEGSQIYQDAGMLERALNCKIQDMGGTVYESPKLKIPIKRVVKETASEELNKSASSTLKQKMRSFYDAVKEYTDNKNRKLSIIFNKLPSKTDYPDYYEVIKKPIDLDKIGNKLKSSQYESLEDMLSDFVLMFDNACKYNEPDSQIYKDALMLQRMTLQTKVELSEDSNTGVPDIRTLIQELLTNLFISTYNHQDEEGRCFSDSLVEFSEIDSPNDESKKAINLDLIKRNLDKGRYKRLDRFQDDMFEVFEHVRQLSRTDSQVFEDSVELQSYFIKTRDELCKNGEILQSPALQYSEADLQASVETLRAQKLPREQQEAEMEPKHEKETRKDEISSSDSATFQNQNYYVGDFVYIEPREKGMDPHIINIEKLWRDNQGEQWLYGCWFYRPNETFHLATRRFLEKEVFKSDNYNSTPLNQVIGKCYVMFVKDYFKFKPSEFGFKDVYVCESRYSARAKAFKKIKVWNFTPNNHVHIITREESVDPIRVPSMFKDGFEKPKDEDSEDAELGILDKPRPTVKCDDVSSEDKSIYYEQYTIPSGSYKLGDCCYVRTENNKKLIGRIDKMWIDSTGHAYFHGPWFVTPQEVQHPPTRLFFKQEVFLSSIEDTNPLLSIVGHCTVLDYKDYTTKRPTEICEPDVYICESRYMEAERQIRRLPKGLKRFTLSPSVTEDEFYFFRKIINPQKTEVISSPIIPKRALMPTMLELSPLMPRPSIETDTEESNDMTASLSIKEESNSSLPALSSVKKKSCKRIVTGYIVFASEVRRSVIQANPDKTFGDISRMIGTEWRNLPPNQKSEYEERAQKQNEETAAKELLNESMPPSPASVPGNNEKSENTLYECVWDGCDFQFEDFQDLIEHLVVEPNGHVQISYHNKDSDYQCLWQNCSRLKKNVPPFPNLQRLIRHCKEVHLKTCVKTVLPENRGRNYVPSKKNISIINTNSNSANFPASPNPVGTPQQYTFSNNFNTYSRLSATPSHIGHGSCVKSLEPMFVTPPPKTQRILHSGIYIKYIEGLQADSRYISNWDSHLKALPETTTPSDMQRLPTQWLGNGVGNHGNVVNALWALRNFMLKDSLNISSINLR